MRYLFLRETFRLIYLSFHFTVDSKKMFLEAYLDAKNTPTARLPAACLRRAKACYLHTRCSSSVCVVFCCCHVTALRPRSLPLLRQTDASPVRHSLL